jgi:hypothetical protein
VAFVLAKVMIYSLLFLELFATVNLQAEQQEHNLRDC